MNPRYPLQVAIAVSGISTLLMPFAMTYGWLILYSVVLGLADGGMGSSCFVVPVKLLARDERAIGFGIVALMTCIGFSAGPPLGGELYEAYSSAPRKLRSLFCFLFFLPCGHLDFESAVTAQNAVQFS